MSSVTTILGIHGFLDRGEDYSLLAEALGAHGNVVAHDAPGHTKLLGHPFRMVEWLEALENEIIKHEKSVLVGHSAGGHLAMLAAGTALRWQRRTQRRRPNRSEHPQAHPRTGNLLGWRRELARSA